MHARETFTTEAHPQPCYMHFLFPLTRIVMVHYVCQLSCELALFVDSCSDISAKVVYFFIGACLVWGGGALQYGGGMSLPAVFSRPHVLQEMH